MSTANKKLKLILPLPPSNNEYLYPKRMGKYVRLAETAKSKKWKKKVTPIIEKEIEKQNWNTVPRGTFLNIHIDYFFNRKGSDPNNYLKILYDVMENCGVYENDDMAKPQTGLVVIDKYDPRIEIYITIDDQVGAFKNDETRSNFMKEYSKTLSDKEFKKIMKLLDDNRVEENIEFDEDLNVYYKEDNNGK